MQLWPLLGILTLSSAALATKISIPEHSRQCFSQKFTELLPTGFVEEGQPLQLAASLLITSGDRSGTAAGNRLETQITAVDAGVLDPAGNEVLVHRQLPAAANLTAPAPAGFGRYSLCLTNGGSQSVLVEIVHFTLVEEGDTSAMAVLSQGGRASAVSQLDPVREQVLWLQELLQTLGEEQRSMRARFEQHFATNLSTERRTKYCSAAEVVALLATSLLQVFVIMRFFSQHGVAITRRLSTQALTGRSSGEAADMALDRASPQNSFSSGGGLQRSFSRRRLATDGPGDPLDSVAINLFSTPSSSERDRRRGPGWGSSSNLSGMLQPAPHAALESPGRRSAGGSPPRRRISAEFDRAAAEVHAHASPLLQKPAVAWHGSAGRHGHASITMSADRTAALKPLNSRGHSLPEDFTPELGSLHHEWRQGTNQVSDSWNRIRRSGSASSLASVDMPSFD